MAVMNLMVGRRARLPRRCSAASGDERSAGGRSSSLLAAARRRQPAVHAGGCCPKRGRRPDGAQVTSLARNYGQLLVSPSFLGFAVGGGCATTSMYAFIGASPFIFVHQLNRPDYEVGIYPAIVLARASGSAACWPRA